MSREFKGTPGPWKWVSGNHNYYHFLKSVGGTYVHSDGSACGEYSPDIDVNGSDAKLIAAAPELLEALQTIVGYIKQDGSYSPLAIESLELVINKALGEE
jgi:hypothetical protein